MLPNGPRGSHVIVAAALLLAVPALAGCIGSQTSGDAAGAATSPQGDEIEPSDATQALWDEGYKDPYLDVEPTGDVEEFEFWVNETAAMNPYGDLELGAFTFAPGPDKPGQVPGPEIRVQQGDTVRVILHDKKNALHLEGHTMHWHGIDIPWRSDGVPFVTQDVTPAGEKGKYVYEFVARQPGTYWYHCVVDFPAHVDAGLFGALIIEPRDPDHDLPYDRDETLMFHEIDSQYFAAAPGALNPNSDLGPDRLPSNPDDAIGSARKQVRQGSDTVGFIAGPETGIWGSAEGPRDYYPARSIRYRPDYDTYMINGKSYPDTEPIAIKEGETVRLRLINAGQLHKSIHLHGHHVLVTHNDGYKLPEPHWEDTISLAPGERKDAYVQGTNPGIWKLHDHSGSSGTGSTNVNDYAFPGGMITAMVYEDFQPPEGLPAGDASDNTAGDYAVHAHGTR